MITALTNRSKNEFLDLQIPILRKDWIQAFTIVFAIICLHINSTNAQDNIDINGDGSLNILILGTNNSINNTDIFSPNLIANELQSILSADGTHTLNVNVISEDIHMSKPVTLGLGGAGTE